MAGKVTLVGAGPGDPGLLTVKGRAALAAAESVVYDRLIHPALLDLAPQTARRINVGKTAGHHPVPQQQINQILLEEAQAGRQVVRLKGGDPFLFGRGGEELAFLASHGVPYEEIPGIPSAIAAAAYGGIPVTHRDCASALHILTAHVKDNAPLSIDFEALVRAGGTMVFLMGVTALDGIVQGLLAAGMDAQTPAAVIENGTLPGQRQCRGTLSDLPERATKMALCSPALIIVGDVCALDFDWFSRLPLRGKRILVTRPRDRAAALADRLRALGGEAVEAPCIETVPILPCPAMEAALENLSRYQWLAFTSPAGVDVFWSCLRHMGRDARALGGIRLAAVGPGTARALSEHGLSADLLPDCYDTAHLGRALAEQAEGRVLLLRAQMGSPALPEMLEQAGIAYDDISVYRTQYLPIPDTLREELAAGQFDFVTFTSASTVRSFVNAVGEDYGRAIGLCIGEQTAAAARAYGIPVRVAREATAEALALSACSSET